MTVLKQKGNPRHWTGRYGAWGVFEKRRERRQTRHTAAGLLRRWRAGEAVEDLLPYRAPREWLD